MIDFLCNLCLLAAALVFESITFTAGIPYQNAIHYWPMNNISSRGAMYDLRGRSQASAYNGIVSKTTNQLGRVSVFDGLDDWIRIKGFQEKCITDPSICENGLSIGFWLKMLGGDYIISGGHYGARPSGPGFRIFQDTDSKQYRVEVATRSDLWRVSLHALPTSWFHLLFTWNKQNGLQLYLNGRFAIQGSGPNKIDNLLKDIENDQVVVIGKPDTFVRLRSYGRFEIGHLVIWDYPLPAMEVKQAYKAMVQTNAKSTVCCYYRMSDKCSRYPCYRFQNPVLCSGVIENKKCICPDIPGPRKCDERIFAGKCADRRPDCSQLASQPGYCDHFQQEMETLCPAACNYCVPEPKLAGRNERRKLSREILIFSILGCVVGIILLFLISIYSWKVYRKKKWMKWRMYFVSAIPDESGNHRAIKEELEERR